jgi:hypothetical protein
MSVVINILAAIGLIVIISYIVYYLFTYFQNAKFQKTISQINPPPSYMQNVGINCPDYWINMGPDSNGNIQCKNSFNIPVSSSTTCPSTMVFPSIPSGQSWDYGNPNGLTSMSDNDKYKFLNTLATGPNSSAISNSLSRCSWINQCGPSNTVQGVWQGVNEICNSPPSSS